MKPLGLSGIYRDGFGAHMNGFPFAAAIYVYAASPGGMIIHFIGADM